MATLTGCARLPLPAPNPSPLLRQLWQSRFRRFPAAIGFSAEVPFRGCTIWKINIDPENHPFLVETNLLTSICQGLYWFTGAYWRQQCFMKLERCLVKTSWSPLLKLEHCNIPSGKWPLKMTIFSELSHSLSVIFQFTMFDYQRVNPIESHKIP